MEPSTPTRGSTDRAQDRATRLKEEAGQCFQELLGFKSAWETMGEQKTPRKARSSRSELKGGAAHPCGSKHRQSSGWRETTGQSHQSHLHTAPRLRRRLDRAFLGADGT